MDRRDFLLACGATALGPPRRLTRREGTSIVFEDPWRKVRFDQNGITVHSSGEHAYAVKLAKLYVQREQPGWIMPASWVYDVIKETG